MPRIIRLNKDLLLTLYRKERLSVVKIAQRLKYSPTCVYNNLLRYKIPIVGNSERYRGRKLSWSISEEGRKRISISKTRDKNPAKRIDVRRKISMANKGRKFSDKTKQKMSEAQRGRVICWGDKISAAKKKWYASYDGKIFIKKLRQRTKSNNPMFNKSEDIKRRHWTVLSDGPKRIEIINKLRKSRMLQRFPRRSTSIETMMQRELTDRGINFVTHYPIFDICQPDIVIPDKKLVIQCDGDWWHANPKFHDRDSLSAIQKNNIKRDAFQDGILTQAGWHIMRFWESDIENSLSRCVDKIESFLKIERIEAGVAV